MEVSQIIKKNLNLGSLPFRYALRLSIACFIAQLLLFSWHIQDGYWMILTIVVCMLHTIGRTMRRSLQRMLGTFAGGFVAVYIGTHLGAYNYILEALIFILLFFAYYSRALDYGLSTVFLTPAIILFIQVISPGDWEIAWLHLFTVISAGLVMVLFTFLLFPSYSSKMIQQHFNEEWMGLQAFLGKLIQKTGTEKLDSALFENDISDRMSALYFVVKEVEIESFLYRKKMKIQHDNYLFISKISGYLEIILADISFDALVSKKDRYLEDLRQGLMAFYELMGEVTYQNNTFSLSAQGRVQYENLLKRLDAYIAVVYHERVSVFQQEEMESVALMNLIRVHIGLQHLLEATHCFDKLKMV